MATIRQAFGSIATAIRSANGLTTTYTPAQMPDAISTLKNYEILWSSSYVAGRSLGFSLSGSSYKYHWSVTASSSAFTYGVAGNSVNKSVVDIISNYTDSTIFRLTFKIPQDALNQSVYMYMSTTKTLPSANDPFTYYNVSNSIFSPYSANQFSIDTVSTGNGGYKYCILYGNEYQFAFTPYNLTSDFIMVGRPSAVNITTSGMYHVLWSDTIYNPGGIDLRFQNFTVNYGSSSTFQIIHRFQMSFVYEQKRGSAICSGLYMHLHNKAIALQNGGSSGSTTMYIYYVSYPETPLNITLEKFTI